MEKYAAVVVTMVIITIAVTRFFRELSQAKTDTVKLIASLMKNAQENLGHVPDAASVVYLANHPFLSKKIWEMLGAGGVSFSGYMPEYETDCSQLMQLIQDNDFQKKYPSAHALIQYTIYLCDTTLIRGPRLGHPKDEVQRNAL